MSTQFDNVSVLKKGNVYFDGKCVSHTVIFADGSKKTLRDVVDFYAGGGNSNPQLDKEIKELKLSGQDRADLVAFLEALTCEPPKNAGPPQQ